MQSLEEDKGSCESYTHPHICQPRYWPCIQVQSTRGNSAPLPTVCPDRLYAKGPFHTFCEQPTRKGRPYKKRKQNPTFQNHREQSIKPEISLKKNQTRAQQTRDEEDDKLHTILMPQVPGRRERQQVLGHTDQLDHGKGHSRDLWFPTCGCILPLGIYLREQRWKMKTSGHIKQSDLGRSLA